MHCHEVRRGRGVACAGTGHAQRPRRARRRWTEIEGRETAREEVRIGALPSAVRSEGKGELAVLGPLWTAGTLLVLKVLTDLY